MLIMVIDSWKVQNIELCINILSTMDSFLSIMYELIS